MGEHIAGDSPAVAERKRLCSAPANDPSALKSRIQELEKELGLKSE